MSSRIDKDNGGSADPVLQFRNVVWDDDSWGGDPVVELVLKNTTAHDVVIPSSGEEPSEPVVRVPPAYRKVDRFVGGEWRDITLMSAGVAFQYTINPGGQVFLHTSLPHDAQPGWTLRITVGSVTSEPFQVSDNEE